MVLEQKIRSIIEEVLGSLDGAAQALPAQPQESSAYGGEGSQGDEPSDLSAVDLKTDLQVIDPANREAYLKLKSTTPARLGIGRSGARYLTRSWLRFRADHAVAQDAVFNEVSEEFLKEWGLLEVKTPCRDKDEFLTRPDLGRLLDQDNSEILRKNCEPNSQVQIFISDGLSSMAVEANARDAYLAMVQGLQGQGIKAGTPFFIRYGRVPVMEAVATVLKPQVTALLIGERPGLATGESMSCYMAYDARPGMSESKRTVVSNIHKGGTPAVEAGANIADIIKKMLDQKANGLDLKQ